MTGITALSKPYLNRYFGGFTEGLQTVPQNAGHLGALTGEDCAK